MTLFLRNPNRADAFDNTGEDRIDGEAGRKFLKIVMATGASILDLWAFSTIGISLAVLLPLTP